MKAFALGSGFATLMCTVCRLIFCVQAYKVETGKDKIERGRAEWVEWKRQEAQNQANSSEGEQPRGRGS